MDNPLDFPLSAAAISRFILLLCRSYLLHQGFLTGCTFCVWVFFLRVICSDVRAGFVSRLENECRIRPTEVKSNVIWGW